MINLKLKPKLIFLNRKRIFKKCFFIKIKNLEKS